MLTLSASRSRLISTSATYSSLKSVTRDIYRTSWAPDGQGDIHHAHCCLPHALFAPHPTVAFRIAFTNSVGYLRYVGCGEEGIHGKSAPSALRCKAFASTHPTGLQVNPFFREIECFVVGKQGRRSEHFHAHFNCKCLSTPPPPPALHRTPAI